MLNADECSRETKTIELVISAITTQDAARLPAAIEKREIKPSKRMAFIP